LDTVAHPLFTFGIVLTAAIIGGEIASRLRIPRVTGWIVTGIGLGSFTIPGLEPETLKGFWPLTDFVLGYIAFAVGSHLNFRQLRNAGKRLGFLVLGEALITPAVVVVAMTFLGGFPFWVSLVFAAVAVAGAPGTTILVVREARARGIFVRTLVPAVALIDMVAVSVFVVIEAELEVGIPTSVDFLITSLPHALKVLAIAAGIGVAVATFVILVTRKIVGPKLLAAALVAAILLSWGIADLVGVSSILACTFTGMALGNIMQDKERAGEGALHSIGDILFTAFYCFAGLRLDFGNVVPLAGMIALFFGARALGKVLSTFTSMSLSGSVKSVRQ
jgi:Kef-type K+ transport system membrane component KefB